MPDYGIDYEWPGFQAFGNQYKIATYHPANLLELSQTANVEAGSIATVALLGGALFVYGTGWRQVSDASFASTSARDTAYAQASGVYRVRGVRARIGSTLWEYSGAAWSRSRAENLRPSSLSGITGTSAVINADGSVSCTNVTAVTLNGLFGTDINEYEVSWDATATTGATWNLTAAGAAQSGSNYSWFREFASGTTWNVGGGSGTPSIPSHASGSVTNGYGRLKLFGPAQARVTHIDSEFMGYSATDAVTDTHIKLSHKLTNSYDGLALADGGFTGTITVRGLG